MKLSSVEKHRALVNSLQGPALEFYNSLGDHTQTFDYEILSRVLWQVFDVAPRYRSTSQRQSPQANGSEEIYLGPRHKTVWINSHQMIPVNLTSKANNESLSVNTGLKQWLPPSPEITHDSDVIQSRVASCDAQQTDSLNHRGSRKGQLFLI